jgi:hypothetical protein
LLLSLTFFYRPQKHPEDFPPELLSPFPGQEDASKEHFKEKLQEMEEKEKELQILREVSISFLFFPLLSYQNSHFADISINRGPVYEGQKMLVSGLLTVFIICRRIKTHTSMILRTRSYSERTTHSPL